jgi:hypothetical protein
MERRRREAGYDDGQIFADAALADTVPGPVRAAVTFGRPISAE